MLVEISVSALSPEYYSNKTLVKYVCLGVFYLVTETFAEVGQI